MKKFHLWNHRRIKVGKVIDIFEKNYEGFESLSDIERDISECFDERFNEQMKFIPAEFQGTLTVTITYETGEGE
jgi:hypothetical protein